MSNLAQLPLIFTSQSDPCAKRHKGNSESRAAFDSILPRLKGKRLQVLRTVCDLERATLKEIVDCSKLPIQTVSGRLAELKQGGMIYGTAEVRDGCRVLTPTFVLRTYTKQKGNGDMRIIGKTANGLLVDATEDEMCRLTGYSSNWYRERDSKSKIGPGSEININATYLHIQKVNDLKDQFERARAALDYLMNGLVLTRDSLHTALTPPKPEEPPAEPSNA